MTHRTTSPAKTFQTIQQFEEARSRFRNFQSDKKPVAQLGFTSEPMSSNKGSPPKSGAQLSAGAQLSKAPSGRAVKHLGKVPSPEKPPSLAPPLDPKPKDASASHAPSPDPAPQSGYTPDKFSSILDFSPFNFFNGITTRRLQKGRSFLSKQKLLEQLTCSFCLNITVQGKQCPECNSNFCHPCHSTWEQSESARYFKTPCKCKNAKGLESLSKIKIDNLKAVRFKCSNSKCRHQLTYEELILGMHELDRCNFIKVVCEGCSLKIAKNELIRHDVMACKNPRAKCKFCGAEFHLRQLQEHMRDCDRRILVKMEYFCENMEDSDSEEGCGLDVSLKEQKLYARLRTHANFKDISDSKLRVVVKQCVNKFSVVDPQVNRQMLTRSKKNKPAMNAPRPLPKLGQKRARPSFEEEEDIQELPGKPEEATWASGTPKVQARDELPEIIELPEEEAQLKKMMPPPQDSLKLRALQPPPKPSMDKAPPKSLQFLKKSLLSTVREMKNDGSASSKTQNLLQMIENFPSDEEDN